MALKKDLQQIYENLMTGENLFKQHDIQVDPNSPSPGQTNFMTANNAALATVQQEAGLNK